MTKKEKLFVNTVIELEERFNKKTEYDLLKASGLIRQLIVDANPLVTQINKKHKLKIKFKVLKRFTRDDLNIDTNETECNNLVCMIFISPSKSENFVELLSKDEFLKYKLLFHRDIPFTVLDVIKICANKYGGVHIEDIKEGKSLKLDKLSSLVTLNGSKSVLHAMYGIVEVCLNTLIPLKNVIINDD